MAAGVFFVSLFSFGFQCVVESLRHVAACVLLLRSILVLFPMRLCSCMCRCRKRFGFVVFFLFSKSHSLLIPICRKLVCLVVLFRCLCDRVLCLTISYPTAGVREPEGPRVRESKGPEIRQSWSLSLYLSSFSLSLSLSLSPQIKTPFKKAPTLSTGGGVLIRATLSTLHKTWTRQRPCTPKREIE